MSEISYIHLAKQMESVGVQTIVFTDISRDGTLAGPNFEQLGLLQKVWVFVSLPLEEWRLFKM